MEGLLSTGPSLSSFKDKHTQRGTSRLLDWLSPEGRVSWCWYVTVSSCVWQYVTASNCMRQSHLVCDSMLSSVQPIRPGQPAQCILPRPLGQWLLICNELPSSRVNVLCKSPQCPVPRTDRNGCRISCSGGDESLVLDRRWAEHCDMGAETRDTPSGIRMYDTEAIFDMYTVHTWQRDTMASWHIDTINTWDKVAAF